MTFEITGVWGMAIIATPVVLLLLAAWAYARGEAMARARPVEVHRQPAAAASTVTERAPESASPPPAPRLVVPAPVPAPSPARPAARTTLPLPARTVPVSEARAVPPLPELPRPPFPKAPPAAADLAKALAEAEAAGATDAVADLKVALGMARFREGTNAAQAANDVRNGLIMALQQGRKLAQARARVALGDLCKASDDLTTACEHWQIARDLYAELKETSERKDAETRIRANGCPTDWVLNEF